MSTAAADGAPAAPLRDALRPAAIGYLPHVDGLRAIAVLAVLVYHARPNALPGGFVGVDAFFAISGFVVTAALAGHTAERPGAYMLGFYHRRLTRILPALLVVLLVTALAWTLLIPRSWLSGQAERVGLAAYAGVSNWMLANQADAYFAPRAEFNPFTHTWSLGVEEQFYLVAPWLIFLAGRWRTAAHALIALLLSASLALALAWHGARPTDAFYSVFTRFWELAAGALWFRLLWLRGASMRPRALDTAMGVAGTLLLGVAMVGARPDGMPYPWALPAVAGSLLLIGLPVRATSEGRTDERRGGALHRALGAAPMRWIGLRSYSLYLWHWPVFVLARWTAGLERPAVVAAAVVLSFACAAASFRFVESPLRRSRRWQQLPHGVTTLALVLAAALAAALSWALFDARDRLGLSAVSRASIDWYANHHDPTLAPSPCGRDGPSYRHLGRQLVIEHEPCPAGGAPPRQLFVLGDSHATAYLPMLHRLSRDEHVQVRVYQSPGCPFVDLRAPMGEGRPPACLEDARAALADIRTLARPGDVAMLASLRVPRFGDQWAVWPSEPVLRDFHGPGADSGRARALLDAPQWLGPLHATGLHVVMAAPLPIFRSPPFRCADRWTRMNAMCAAGFVEDESWERALRAPVLAAIEQVRAQAAPGAVSVFDPFARFCAAQRCSALDEHARALFFDADHLSRLGNDRVYPAWRAHWRCVVGGGSACGP